MKIKSNWYNREVRSLNQQADFREDIRTALLYCVWYYTRKRDRARLTCAKYLLQQAKKEYTQIGFGLNSRTDRRLRYVKLNEDPYLSVEIPHWNYEPCVEELNEEELEEKARENGQFGVGA